MNRIRRGRPRSSSPPFAVTLHSGHSFKRLIAIKIINMKSHFENEAFKSNEREFLASRGGCLVTTTTV